MSPANKPEVETTVTVSFRWPPNIRDVLEKLAADEKRTLTQQALLAVEEHLVKRGRWPLLDYVFDDDVHIDEGREIVFSWLTVGKERVRVQASRLYMADECHIPWGNKKAIKQMFKFMRASHADAASKSAGHDGGVRFYPIG